MVRSNRFPNTRTASFQCVVYLGETPIVVASKYQGYAADRATFDQSRQIRLDPMLRITAGTIDAYIVRAIIGDADKEPFRDHEVQGPVKPEKIGLYGVEDAV